MQFYGAPSSIERKSEDRREEIELRAGTHQIPVLRTPEDWMLSDTTPILALLDTRFPERRLFPSGPLGVLVHIVEEVLDEWMARTMVHYRWPYDENMLAVASNLLERELTLAEARQLPLARWGLRAFRATGTESPAQQSASEREYLAISCALSEQLAETRFALGDRPCAVDTILIGSLRGHSNNDPLPDIDQYERILAWDAKVNDYAGSEEDLADFPHSTPYADHLLTLAREQYRPFILGNKAALAAGDKVFVAETYSEPVSYLCRQYPERSREMIVDRIRQQLNSTERRNVMEWLESIGLAECFAS
jgi:glutathione S-transferase